MANGQLSHVVRYLGRVLGDSDAQRSMDGQLLEQYVTHHDEDAFAALVHRYGRLVRSVCRRILRHEQDIDDAFQATFLVFASRAASIRKTSSVASWLYGTAYRTAMNSRRARARRREEQREPTGCTSDQPITEAALREIQAILDEEVQQLSEKYRLPFILCCLEGKSRKEAARRLGLKEGTISSRVAQARKQLQQRLARRGILLSAALCAVEVSRNTVAAHVAPTLASHTIQGALAFAGSKAVASDIVSSEVAGLAQGVLHGLFTSSCKMAVIALLAIGIVTGAGLFAYRACGDKPVARQQAATPADRSATPRGKSRPALSRKEAAKEPEKDIARAYPLGDASHWLPQLESFYLRAEARYEPTPVAIARRLREIKGQFPGLKDPDPLVFTGLLPVQDASVECAFDRSRLRFADIRRTADGRKLNSDLRIWDGKRALMHEQYFRSGQNSYRLAPTLERVVQYAGGASYLRKQPPVLWWNNTPQAKKDFEQFNGTPADYVFVGRDTFHGVDCHVLLSCAGNQSDRYYLGVKDGRWYGAREGIIALPPGWLQKEQRLIEEFLGKKFGDHLSASDWEDIRTTLHTLPRDKKIAWARRYYARQAKHYTPVFEYWFSDFRDLGKGRVFPYRENFLFYEHEGPKIFLDLKFTLTIKELKLDRPLADRLFQEPLTEGATIADDTHQPPLVYKHKAKFTPEEWQAIVKKAKERDRERTAQEQRVKQLIGKPAPPFPAGDWLHSRPLTWADLRGKVVVLKFWSIGCAPCYAELPALREPGRDAKDGKQKKTKTEIIPLVFIGIHVGKSDREAIEKVIKKYKLAAPIYLDDTAAFLKVCAVKALPTSIAVDEKGRILAHGSFSEVISAAEQHRRKVSRKE